MSLPTRKGIIATLRAYTRLRFKRANCLLVILSQSRTGSTHLRELLSQSNSIECFGEVMAGAKHGYINITCGQLLESLDPRLQGISYLGFKLFYYHPFGGSYHAILEQLPPSTKIIHLVRRDFIGRGVSQFIAEKTDAWYRKKKFDYNLINYSELLHEKEIYRLFIERRKMQTEAQRYLSDSKFSSFEIETQELNSKQKIRDLSNFLELENNLVVLNVSSKRKKQIDTKIPNYISEELRARLGREDF